MRFFSLSVSVTAKRTKDPSLFLNWWSPCWLSWSLISETIVLYCAGAIWFGGYGSQGARRDFTSHVAIPSSFLAQRFPHGTQPHSRSRVFYFHLVLCDAALFTFSMQSQVPRSFLVLAWRSANSFIALYSSSRWMAVTFGYTYARVCLFVCCGLLICP